MPHDELVKRLRCQLYGNCPACVNWYAEEVEPNLWRERCLAIDAADAIEELEKEVQNWKITAGEEASGLEHWFENYQKDIPHWIPVTELLPEESEGLRWREELTLRFTSVWCCDVNTGTIEVRNRLQGKKTGIDGLDQYMKDTDWHWSQSWWEPTHWMQIVPLPEPPKEMEP